jgi:hypothetical protein
MRALLFALFFFVACSSESKIGEECDEQGKTDDECESGGVCGKSSAGTVICLKICSDQTQCGADEDCNGVEGTNLKGCRRKATSTVEPVDGGKK